MKRFMIYTKRRNFSRPEIETLVKDNVNIIQMFIFLICGIIAGSAAGIRGTEKIVFIQGIIKNIIYNYSEPQFFVLYISMSLFFIAVIISGALSALGYPLICFSVILKGFTEGFIASGLILNDGLKGFMLFVMSLMPGDMIFISSYMILSQICLSVSVSVSRFSLFDRGDRSGFKENILNILILTGICLSSSLLNTVLRALFIKLF